MGGAWAALEIGTVLAGRASGDEQEPVPTAGDLSTGGEIPTPQGALPLERLQQLVSHEATGAYAPARVISPTMALAVRQEHPDGPRYQEALNYTFLVHLINSPAWRRWTTVGWW